MRIFYIYFHSPYFQVTYFIDGVTLGMKAQSTTYLLSGNKQIYWTLDLEVEVHKFMGFEDFKNAKAIFLSFFSNTFIGVKRGMQCFFGWVYNFSKLFLGCCLSWALALILDKDPPPKSL